MVVVSCVWRPVDQSALTEAGVQVRNDAVYEHRDEPQEKPQRYVPVYDSVQQGGR